MRFQLLTVIAIFTLCGITSESVTAQTNAECHGLEKPDGTFVVVLQKEEIAIPVISLGAKLLRCEKFPKTSNLWVAEIELGEAGTTSLRRVTDLFVFSTKSGKAEKIFQKNIGVTKSGADPVSGKLVERSQKRGYQLQVGEKGEPQVRFDGGEPETLIP